MFPSAHHAAKAVALSAIAAFAAVPAIAQSPFGSNDLIEAAKKEGTMIYYTANFTEVEQEIIKAFNKRFPFVKIELVRAPGGQLITRVKTEAAAGKLAADVVDHSDRALMSEITDLFQDYAPPNAADYIPDVLISPKLWPRVTLAWSIAYNTELVKKPPKTWMDLTKPEYGNKQIGQVIAPVRRHDLDARHVRASGARRGLLEEAGRDQSGAAIPPARRPPTRWCAATFRSRRCSTTSSTRRRRDGAPRGIFFPPEGVPVNPYASRRTEDRRASECRKAVPQLVPVRRRPDLHDQGAWQSHLAEEGAVLSGGL